MVVQGESDDLTSSQGQSYIVDHDSQYWVAPSVTLVRGRHTFQLGFQHEITLDDYAQSNIISGCIGFGGSFTEDYNTASDPTASGAGAPVGTGNQFGLADFLLGWGGSAGQQTGNHSSAPL